ncbi:ATP synthase subunit I [Pseudooceanicola nanhaiensis]|uniref:N-ATPase subunit AtpR n=1 Tax=Pseudooceanicola nanhaiensis TaxID=375761 RepID=UPI001CD72E0A|nr:ATP synthase subunit I [Pseudooceanicola nanhaiensis]MCA0920139.1 hypothetical protein [Pseudooceanicola nanhaiensis]
MTLDALLTAPLLLAALALAAGTGAGIVHFASLRRVTALYLEGGLAARTVALQLLRLALLAALLVGLALLGALPLLCGTLGLLLGRQIVLRRARGAA